MEEIDIPSAVSIFDCVSQLCFSTGHVAIGVLKGNGRSNILQCRDTEWKTQCLCRDEEKKLLKFIGWKKESTAEYITQHQLFQGQQRSDCSSGTLSSSQWDWWDYTEQEKSGITAAEWQAPNAYTQSVTASLHHGPHIYMCPLTACVGLYLQHKGANPQQPLTYFFFQIYQPCNGPMLVFTRLLWPLIEKT